MRYERRRYKKQKIEKWNVLGLAGAILLLFVGIVGSQLLNSLTHIWDIYVGVGAAGICIALATFILLKEN